MSQAEHYFSRDYAEARAKFIEASRRAGGLLQSFVNERAKGPAGETLTCDVSWHGPKDAEAVLVTVSATHGAEGFCGSGAQIGTLESGEAQQLPARTALLQVHAINPYGFAWLRRVTEDNIDLNRNYLAHGQEPYPENPGYEELHPDLCPPTWDDATIASTGRRLRAYAEQHGTWAFRCAVGSGQYRHADGLFYGGQGESWSNRTLRALLRDNLREAKRVAIVDYHTGLGPRGFGERISDAVPGTPTYARTQAFYGEDFTSVATGDSASMPVTGENLVALEATLSHAEVTSICLEYGTLPNEEIKLALRADNWLHSHGEIESAKGRAIKEQIRNAFYQDARDWKEAIWERALETQRKALGGLWM
jgi:hypothetical protein